MNLRLFSLDESPLQGSIDRLLRWRSPTLERPQHIVKEGLQSSERGQEP